jgi:hypothetical protein
VNIVFVSVLYNEPDPSTYQGFKILRGEESHVFNTGNPTLDYLTAGATIYLKWGKSSTIMFTSSIDHFVMDGGDLQDEDPPAEVSHAAVEKALSLFGASP